MTRPRTRTEGRARRKKPFVVDYSVVGTLHLSSRNHLAVEARARAIIKRATEELREVSVYCEDEVERPIDVEERYGKRP